jgi:fructose transport system substrate-binding protein
MLDLAPGISVGQLRHDGFLKGFGIKEGDPQIVGAAPTQGDTAKGQAAMENLLQKDPGINIIYSINEPSGFGGATALKAAGKDPKDFILVSVDGGCEAIEKGIKTGVIDATSQQYPLKMASLGVEKGAAWARGGEKPSGYTDTGVELITADPVDGVESKDAAYGEENCWG